MTRIEMTQAITAALAAVAEAERVYVAGNDPGSVMELPKLALADAVLAAVRAVRAAKTKKLPARADAGVVYVRLEPIARKRRA